MRAERLEVGNGGVVRCGNVPVKNNATSFLFQKAICKYLISNPFHRLESAVPLCQKKAQLSSILLKL